MDEDKRIITGIASTPSPDRYGDVIDPDGAKFKAESPFLWQHDSIQPIGNCSAKKVKEGIEIIAQLVKPTPDMPSQLSARLDEAWHSIKNQLVRGLSIGFKPIKYAHLDTGGINFIEWELLEVSAVTIPANADCSIQTIKSFDREILSAIGKENEWSKIQKYAGDTAKINNFKKVKSKMNVAEQIKSFENKRAALSASLTEIMAKSAEEGRTLDTEETESYDNISCEVKSVDEHLKRLYDMESNMAATAQPVTKAGTGEIKVVGSAPAVIRVEQKLEKGIGFARFAKCLAAGNGSRSEALQIAKSKYQEDTKLHHVLKSAVSAGTTTDPSWAGSLVEYQDYANDFIEYLRPQTIIGRFGRDNIPALRQVPFNVRIPAQISGGSAGWVGQGRAKPLTKFDFETVTFSFAKVAAIAVLTEELIRFSNPAADALVRNSLAEAVIARLDTDFIDIDKAEEAGVSPASITNGITAIQSSGNPDTDSAAALGQFVSSEIQPTGSVWLMSSTTALTLSMLKNGLGQKVYPEMTMLGGTFQGLPVIVSQYVGSQLILVNAPDIYLADDGGVAIDMSREASLEMQSAPNHNSIDPAGTQLVSMFQTNSVAIRAERWINWKRRRNAAVAVISNVNYSASATS